MKLEIDEIKELIERIEEDLRYLKEYRKINAIERLLKEKFGEDNLKFFKDVIDEDKRLGEISKIKWEKDLAQAKKDLKKKESEG